MRAPRRKDRKKKTYISKRMFTMYAEQQRLVRNLLREYQEETDSEERYWIVESFVRQFENASDLLSICYSKQKLRGRV
jgi:hypothetical protein